MKDYNKPDESDARLVVDESLCFICQERRAIYEVTRQHGTFGACVICLQLLRAKIKTQSRIRTTLGRNAIFQMTLGISPVSDVLQYKRIGETNA